MSTTLHLSMYAKRGKRASLVLKRNGLMYRVNNLLSPLAFMANMVQLAKAIESGARQDCCLHLYDHRKTHWVLDCLFQTITVCLSLWLDNGQETDRSISRFYWEGSPADFNTAVSSLAVLA